MMLLYSYRWKRSILYLAMQQLSPTSIPIRWWSSTGLVSAAGSLLGVRSHLPSCHRVSPSSCYGANLALHQLNCWCKPAFPSAGESGLSRGSGFGVHHLQSWPLPISDLTSSSPPAKGCLGNRLKDKKKKRKEAKITKMWHKVGAQKMHQSNWLLGFFSSSSAVWSVFIIC